ncbi:small metal-binding protein SmbP [Methylocystis heyeri]|uniref:Uncharacterized protein n=1 Tax=Methylocystis heyeri TaxID=391905 RepID=A0A6B8KFG4_9HYPH|nr:small metal-binding protein SmbP [Methylocystis heyeri]QGM45705.1 hypothetical protein H2LOC_008325 [Methylocystis heyeri]
MNFRRYLTSIGLALALLAAPASAQPQQSHLDMAIAETQKAIHYGTEPHHGSSFIQHIDNAIDHAVMAQKAHPNMHIKKAILYLRHGRRIVDGSHWPSILHKGATQATKALGQLKAAK